MRSLLLLIALMLPPLLRAAEPLPPAPRCNFLLINIDDLGYGDIGPYGSTIPTPALDRMAREGRRLTSHYGAVVCSPSRAALMTGCYPKRVLPIPHVLFPVARVGLNPAEQTVAGVLRAAGYATACIGKWHLGDQAPFLPRRYGFDYYFGLPYSNDMGPEEDGTKSSLGQEPRRPASGRPAEPPDDGTGTRGNQPPLALLENEQVLERLDRDGQLRLLGRYTDKAKEYLRDHAAGPFFLYFAPNAVHFPFYPSPEFQEPAGHGDLAGMVREVDRSVGELLDTLRELNLAEKTLVVFTSDNGGSVPQGGHNAPLRGSKGETWEGGIRVPTIAWWPGHVPAGTRTAEITSMMDILPTFAALAGAKTADGRPIDGIDIRAILLSQPQQAEPRTFCYYRGLKLEAVRRGPWKLHLEKGLLYNLDEDVSEAHDTAADHPEQVAALQAAAKAIEGDLGLTGTGPGCREMGRVETAVPLWR